MYIVSKYSVIFSIYRSNAQNIVDHVAGLKATVAKMASTSMIILLFLYNDTIRELYLMFTVECLCDMVVSMALDSP